MAKASVFEATHSDSGISRNGEDTSPPYPSHRLFQDGPGVWSAVAAWQDSGLVEDEQTPGRVHDVHVAVSRDADADGAIEDAVGPARVGLTEGVEVGDFARVGRDGDVQHSQPLMVVGEVEPLVLQNHVVDGGVEAEVVRADERDVRGVRDVEHAQSGSLSLATLEGNGPSREGPHRARVTHR